MKRITLLKEKYAHEREHILDQLRANERELAELKATTEGQVRLIQNVTGHMKNKTAMLNDDEQARKDGYPSSLAKTVDDAERNERLAK